MMLESFLRIIRDPENRGALSWLGGGVVVLASGIWFAVTYYFPPAAPPVAEEPAVQAEDGSIASGRDTNIEGGVRLGGSSALGTE